MLETMIFIIILILAVAVVMTKNNLYLIMYFSVFSFSAAAAYFILKAPDIALAEVAIGCAFVPLIFLITVGKQKVFTVIFFDGAVGDHGSLDFNTIRRFYIVLDRFCLDYGLDLNLINRPTKYNTTVHGVFRPGNTDLICVFHPEQDYIEVMGNASNIMLEHLEQRLHEDGQIEWERVKDHEGEL